MSYGIVSSVINVLRLDENQLTRVWSTHTRAKISSLDIAKVTIPMDNVNFIFVYFILLSVLLYFCNFLGNNSIFTDFWSVVHVGSEYCAG